jgi:phenylacetate-CoA ligase
MRDALESFSRTWPLIGATQDDMLHCSFPLGIHPVSSLFYRTAEAAGLGTVWAGAGNNTPSNVQIDLIQELKPSIWGGMGSCGIHLANLAQARGIDLSKSSVTKIIVAAEPLSAAKRQKLERSWGAEVYDLFGMTEGAFVAGEGARREGLYICSDMFFCEVVDEATDQPVPAGTPGSLVVTPLVVNEITPFLRWCSGDIVTIEEQEETGSPLSMYPILRHAGRTVGFFKVRGVNINHNELEDLMFYNEQITDFKAAKLQLVAEVAREVWG